MMERIAQLLDNLRTTDNLRQIPSAERGEFIDLSGNDYLGLAMEASAFEEEFLDLHHGRPLLFTSAASRLLSTRQDAHLAFEEELERAYGKPALLFNSGYHANVGVIGSLAAVPGTVFLADKLVHASIIDGLRLSGAPFYRFRHNDMASLAKLIERHAEEAERLVVVTESVFSMDGDRAPLKELVVLKRANPKLMLYVDEAHALGVFGPSGLGLTADPSVSPFVDIMIGTLGKAAASSGAFVVTSGLMKEWILNTARSFIFSTALPPVNVEWSRFMFTKLMEADERREHLAHLSADFRRLIADIAPRFGDFGKVAPVSTTQIVPLITGSSAVALELSRRLRDAGILALPIRRPTVPPGTERLRFSLHANLPDIDAIASKARSVKARSDKARSDKARSAGFQPV